MRLAVWTAGVLAASAILSVAIAYIALYYWPDDRDLFG